MNIGFDGGFYATKAIAGDRRVMFPSCVTKAVDSLFSYSQRPDSEGTERTYARYPGSP